MFDTPLRHFKDRAGAPLAKRMRRISPMFISILALAVGLLAAYAAFKGQYLWAFACWIFNRVLDGLDGLIARLHNGQSDFGGYVDILTDFIVYAALPIGLAAGLPSSDRYLTLAFLLAAFYVNAASWMYLSAILEKRVSHSPETQTTIVMPAGIIGGFETIIAYGVFILFPTYITILFSIFAALVFLTTIQRLIWAKHNLRKHVNIYAGKQADMEHATPSIRLAPDTWNLTPNTELHDTQTQLPRSQLHPAKR
ncbi:MAG: CDP-alcohol phosphatidyltransferase family protein [Chloroflexi bacterium]|nr:CDP-alcohol phosphatidyltransferase family protein [Chloroflexota bacterium]